MKRYLLLLVILTVCLCGKAQNTKPFNSEIHNDEYKIFIKMNLYDKNIVAPDNEALGEIEGYFGSTQSTNKWLIVSSIISGNTAELEVMNDYGSEDFTATITYQEDGTYSYKKKQGSTMKFAVKGKWQKIPSSLTFH
ncbi:MAG: hypothetical protein LUC37_05120 [Prevotella sp.]|nr:hypothetical protein [Prevotella sp.]